MLHLIHFVQPSLQVLSGVSTLLANLTRYQNNLIQSVSTTWGNSSDPALQAQAKAVQQWARENGGTAITTLQDITTVIEGSNRVVSFGEAFYNKSLASGDVSGLTWAAAVIREVRAIAEGMGCVCQIGWDDAIKTVVCPTNASSGVMRTV